MTCILCLTYRPSAQPRLPHQPPVCDGDRRLLDTHLADLPDLHARLSEPEQAEVDTSRPDPLATLGGAGPVPGRSGKPRVSGSRERPAPLPLDRIDLTLPARPASRRLMVRATLGLIDCEDQIGHLSAATTLDAWVRDWRNALWPDHHQPVPTVAALVDWLRKRLADACNQHPAVDEFAADIRELRSALRGALGDTDPQPETDRWEGIACRRCDLRAVLMHRPGDTYIECRNCGTLYTDDELADWTGRLAGYEKSIRTTEEVTELLRRPATHRVAA